MESLGFSRLYGNETIRSFLTEALSHGTLPHALILSGPEGSGKHTLALELACALGGDAFADKIRAGNCPDLIRIETPSDRKSIGVEAARAVREQAAIAPNDLDCKIFIMDNASAMTVQAQNALLKILEEPFGRVYFFLLCENPNGVIPTVRSRAPTLSMQIFSDTALSDWLCENEPPALRLKQSDPSAFEVLVRASGGCIGQAKKLLASRKNGNPSQDACNLLASLADCDRVGWICCVDALPADREKLISLLQELRCALRDLLFVKSVLMREYTETARARAGRGLLCFSDVNGALSLSDRFTVRSLLQLERAVMMACDDLECNTNLANTKQKLGADMRAACDM